MPLQWNEFTILILSFTYKSKKINVLNILSHLLQFRSSLNCCLYLLKYLLHSTLGIFILRIGNFNFSFKSSDIYYMLMHNKNDRLNSNWLIMSCVSSHICLSELIFVNFWMIRTVNCTGFECNAKWAHKHMFLFINSTELPSPVCTCDKGKWKTKTFLQI